MDDDRTQLYLQFVKNIGKHDSADTYDEDDLIDIYDYASDVDDQVTKFEVLLYGQRHYPDSSELLSRRAFMYEQMDEPEVAGLLNAGISEPTFLDRLLQLKLSQPEPEAAKKKLWRLIEQQDDMEDEDIIQMVNVAADLGLSKWLLEARRHVEKHCSYIPTFLYEMGNVAEDDRDFDTAIKMFDELTRIDAFNVNFWQRLVSAYGMAGKFKDAENAAENALAVEPDNVQSKRLLARSLGLIPGFDSAKVMALYQPSIEAGDLEDADLSIITVATLKAGDMEAAYQTFLNIWNKGIRFHHQVFMMTMMKPEEARPLLNKFYAEADPQLNDLLDWLSSLMSQNSGMYTVAGQLLDLYLEDNDPEPVAEIAMDVYYRTGRYDRVAALYEALIGGLGEKDEEGRKRLVRFNRPQIMLPMLMAMARISQREQLVWDLADTMARLFRASRKRMDPAEFSSTLSPISTVANLLADGYLKALNAIKKGLRDGAEPDDYDPIPPLRADDTEASGKP